MIALSRTDLHCHRNGTPPPGCACFNPLHPRPRYRLKASPQLYFESRNIDGGTPMFVSGLAEVSAGSQQTLSSLSPQKNRTFHRLSSVYLTRSPRRPEALFCTRQETSPPPEFLFRILCNDFWEMEAVFARRLLLLLFLRVSISPSGLSDCLVATKQWRT